MEKLSYKTTKTWILRFTSVCYGVNSKPKLPAVFDTVEMVEKEALVAADGQQPGLRARGDD